MRLAHLRHATLPSSHTVAEQVVRSSAALAAAGVEIDLVFPVSRGARGDHAAELARAYGFAPGQWPDRLRLVAVPVRGRSKGWAGDGAFDLKAASLAARGGYDFVWTRDPLALALSLRRGCRAVFEIYRVDYQRSPWLAPWRRYCYRHPRLAGVVAHSHLAGRSLIDAGIDPSRVLVAHNGHVPEHAGGRLPKAAARKALGLAGDQPLVCYAGHVGRRKGTDTILALAAAVPAVRFLVVGLEPGDAASDSFRRAAPPNVATVDRVDPARVPVYLQAADCLLIPPTAAPLVDHGRTVLPMKTFLYLAAARPILAPDLPDLREVLENGRNAVLVPPDCASAAIALERLLADREQQARLAAAALADAARYTWEARADRVRAFLERIR